MNDDKHDLENILIKAFNNIKRDFIKLNIDSSLFNEIIPFLATVIDLNAMIEKMDRRRVIDLFLPFLQSLYKGDNFTSFVTERMELYAYILQRKECIAAWCNGEYDDSNMLSILITAFGDIIYNPKCVSDYYGAPYLIKDILYNTRFTTMFNNIENEVIFFVKKINDDIYETDEDIISDLDDDEDELDDFNSDYIETSTDAFNDVNSTNKINFEEDNYLFITKNACSILHYLLAHYSNKYTFEELFVISVTINLFVFIDEKSLNYDDIIDSLFELFNNNTIKIGRKKYIFSATKYANNDFVFIVLKICLSSIVFLLRLTLDDVGDDAIYSSVLEKIDSIYSFIENIFDEPMYFENDEEKRFLIDKFFVEKKDLVKNIQDNKKHFFNDYELYNITNYYFTDFADDFDTDGFGLKYAIKYFKDATNHLNIENERREYLNHLVNNKSNMIKIVKDIDSTLDADDIYDMSLKEHDDIQLYVAGICYLYGIIVEQNFEMAFNCFKKSSDNLNSQAYLQLSTMYLKSVFVNFSVDGWLTNLNNACRLKNEHAIKEWQRLKEVSYKSVYNKEYSGMGKVLKERYGDHIKNEYFRVAQKIVDPFIDKKELYNYELNMILDYVDCFDYQLKLLGLIRELEKNNNIINYKIASGIASTFESICENDSKNAFELRDDIRFRVSESDFKRYPSYCWKKVANSVRTEDDQLFSIPEYNNYYETKKEPTVFDQFSNINKNNTNYKPKQVQPIRKKNGCYIATCVYGSYDCPQVWILRRYRDYKLAKTSSGRLFIKFYYMLSPLIVKLFGKMSIFKYVWKKYLDHMVKKYKEKGFSDLPYDDPKY